MKARPRRRSLGLATIATLLLAPAAAAAATHGDAAQRLADAYAPITKVRDFHLPQAEAGAPVLTYVQIARQRGHPGFALRYWFPRYLDQAGDRHGNDWEAMEVAFDAETPKQALEEDPGEVVLFQHGGGERAGWDDGKLEKVGTHPVVYTAAGSRAAFYGPGVYVSRSEHGSGLVCDNTTEPLEELKPRPILLPERATDSGGGPTEATSVRVPGAALLAPQATDAFCASAAVFADLLELRAEDSTATVVWLVILVSLLVFFVGFTRWTPLDVEQLRTRRPFGRLVLSAGALYGGHWLAMLWAAVAAIPIVRGTHFLVGHLVPGSSELATTVADLLDCLSWLAGAAIVSAVVIVFVRSLAETGEADTADAWRGIGQRFWRLLAAPLLASLTVLALTITLVGIPLAIWLLARWSLVQQEVAFHDASLGGAFRGSARLVQGRWLHAFRPVLFLSLVGLIGPALHFALLFTTLSPSSVDWISAVVFALLIPFLACGYTLLFFDLEARAGTEPSA